MSVVLDLFPMATQIGSLNTLGKDGKALDFYFSSTSKVRVSLRVRPFLPQEFGKNGDPVTCVSVLDSEPKSYDGVTMHLKDQETR